MSTSLASKAGSLDNLNVSTFHGLSRRARQIRATVSLPTWCLAASARLDQCVASSGRVCNVSCTMASTTSLPISGLRPRPGAIRPTASMPPASNLARQRRTVSAVVSQRRAISLLATPSAANNKARAWSTVRCGNDVDVAIRSSAARSSSVTANRSATITGMIAD